MLDLEAIRSIFKDNSQHIVVGKLTKLSAASDRSCLYCMVQLFDDSSIPREIMARMTWDSVGPGSGMFSFPVVGDLVLVAFADGDVEQAFVIKRMTSKEDMIPQNALDGHTVLKALNGKNLWLTGEKALISQGDADPTENLVLGQQLKNLLVDILTELSDLSQKVANHTHAGNLGYPTSPPNTSADFITISSDFDNLKSSPVEDEAILSDFAFTEKGS